MSHVAKAASQFYSWCFTPTLWLTQSKNNPRQKQHYYDINAKPETCCYKPGQISLRGIKFVHKMIGETFVMAIALLIGKY